MKKIINSLLMSLVKDTVNNIINLYRQKMIDKIIESNRLDIESSDAAIDLINSIDVNDFLKNVK